LTRDQIGDDGFDVGSFDLGFAALVTRGTDFINDKIDYFIGAT
jgi:hypothetical protein